MSQPSSGTPTGTTRLNKTSTVSQINSVTNVNISPHFSPHLVYRATDTSLTGPAAPTTGAGAKPGECGACLLDKAVWVRVMVREQVIERAGLGTVPGRR